MVRWLFKAAIFGLLAAFLVKMLSARRKTTASPESAGTRRKIRTDGLSVRDAEFTDIEKK